MLLFRFLILSLLLLVLTNLQLFAQDVKSVRLAVKSLASGVVLDSLSVKKESIQLESFGKEAILNYELNTGVLKVLFPEEIHMDSLNVKYLTYPFAIHHTYQHRTLKDFYDSTALFKKTFSAPLNPLPFKEEIFSSSSLQKSGVLSRGISFGNTQNLFVNSQLNLQLSGQLSDQLFIRASITDQNVPFQPEGNTQNIQDFDNVLVEIYNDKMNLKAGDIIIQQRDSEFLRYYKNAQGAHVSWKSSPNEKVKISSQVATSLAKGKFTSVQLQVQEGIIGPYRIPGNQQEKYVIIIANSEKVYLDGKLLKRGFNFDYVIDYNLGEISFTPNVLITQYSRVNIDYEYAERNFLRSIIATNHRFQTQRGDFAVNFYREQDNKFRPLFAEFSEDELRKLSEIGNQTSSTNFARVDSMAFDRNKILYKRLYFLDDFGNKMAYYQYSTDPNEAFYSPSFREVGLLNGDYVRVSQQINGAVYEYLPRINNVPQGNFEISTAIPLPNKKQMMTSSGKFTISSHEKIYAEVAFSDHNTNLFSTQNKSENQGFAIKSGLSSQGRKTLFLPTYLFNALTEVEWNSTHFNFIDRWRYIEFDRDWSLSPDLLQQSSRDLLITSQIELIKDANHLFKYRTQWRNKKETLQGIQHQANFKQVIAKRFYVINDFFFLQAMSPNQTSEWMRYSGELVFKNRIIHPGYKFETDKNKLMRTGSGEVFGTAMNYQSHHVYLRSPESSATGFFIESNWRTDFLPRNGKLLSDTDAFTSKIGLKKNKGNHQLNSDFTYRQLEFLQFNSQKETTLLGKIDYQGKFLNNSIQHDLSYVLGNGREFKREFYFIPVPAGEGTHTWRDDNQDGIQQIQEFYLALNPEEKNYIKIIIPTADFVQAYQTLFNYRFNLKMPDFGNDQSGLINALQKFSFNGSINLDRKMDEKDLFKRLNPFYSPLDMGSLISRRKLLRSTLFFNRASTNFGADLNYTSNSFKQLLALGYDFQEHSEWRLHQRMNVNARVNIKWTLASGWKSAASDFFEQRNFQIKNRLIGPELIWQHHQSLRTQWGILRTIRENLSNLEFDEKAILNQYTFDVRFAKAIKTTLNAQLKYTRIKYNGIESSPTGYEMLQALNVGQNFNWSLNLTQKIGEGLQMQMVYDGRASSGLLRPVHVGRMQIVALF